MLAIVNKLLTVIKTYCADTKLLNNKTIISVIALIIFIIFVVIMLHWFTILLDLIS